MKKRHNKASHSRDSAIGGSREYFFKINKVYLIAATRYAILMLKNIFWEIL